MSRLKHALSGWLVIMGCLTACAPLASAQPTRLNAAATPTAAPATATTRPPTITPIPPPTPLRGTQAAPTPAAAPTLAIAPTAAPTRQPPAQPDETQWREWRTDGFEVLLSATTRDAAGQFYAAFLLTNGAINSIMRNDGELVDPSTPTGPGACLLAFYRWDGYQYIPLAGLGRTAAPIWCQVVDWDNAPGLTFFPFAEPSAETRAALGLSGYWSDLNGNGRPELAVLVSDCLNNCGRYQGLTTHYYEITAADKVVDIAAGLPGALFPDHLLHGADPVTLYARATVELTRDQSLEFDRILAVQAGRFADVSAQYPEAYLAQIEQLQAALARHYNSALPLFKTDLFLTLLGLANESGLPPQTGLAAFLEVTDPAHWPGTPGPSLCWLQLTRAYAQIDAAAGQPFRLTPLDGIFLMGEGPGVTFARLIQDIDTTRYDVSACQ